jgi:hypothetical protein
MKTCRSVFVGMVAVIALCFGFVGCDDGNGGPEEIDKTVVYIAGSDSGACYWKNGVRIGLSVPEGTTSSSADAITISDGSIYITGEYQLGTYGNSDYKRLLCYWKDGVLTDLSLPEGYSFPTARAITVSQGSVYIAGDYSLGTPTQPYACYWKDGVRTDFEVGTNAYGTNTIAIAEGSVYVVIYMGDTNKRTTASYWKDGTRIDLPVPEGATMLNAYGIAVSDGSIYVTGEYQLGTYGNSDFKELKCYWKDGVRTDLPFPEEAIPGYNEAGAIATLGGATYVAGSYATSARYSDELSLPVITPCYWKDGVRTDLPIPTGTGGLYADVRAIAASANSVYITGFYRDLSKFDGTAASLIQKACYWKDGKRIDLPVIERASASDIAVVVEG